MTTPHRISAFAIVFSIVYPIAYVVSVEHNYALFTYHPAIGEFGAGVQKAKDGPAMYWYGWLATAAIIAAVASFVAALLPAPLTRRLSPALTWLAALAVLAVFCWLLRGFFLR